MDAYDRQMLLGMAIALAAVLAWDGWLWARFGYPATISAVVTRTGKRYAGFSLLLFLAFAFLLWHWFG